MPPKKRSDESSSNEELQQRSSYLVEHQVVSPSILHESQLELSILNEPRPGSLTLDEPQPEPSTSNDSRLGPSTLNEPQPDIFPANEPRPGPSTLNESQAGYFNTESLYSRDSPSPPITLELIRLYPKAPPRKPTGKQRKGKTTIITETPEKDRLLLENMMDILKKKTPTVEKQNLKHVKQIFKCNLIDKESNKTKGKGKGKKTKAVLNKSVKTTQKKKKTVRKIAKSNSSSDSFSNVDTDFDSTGDITETEEVTPRLRNRSLAENKTIGDDECNVCKKKYSESTEDWFQCKICTKWAHETCGIKGVFNFFCSLCH